VLYYQRSSTRSAIQVETKTLPGGDKEIDDARTVHQAVVKPE